MPKVDENGYEIDSEGFSTDPDWPRFVSYDMSADTRAYADCRRRQREEERLEAEKENTRKGPPSKAEN